MGWFSSSPSPSDSSTDPLRDLDPSLRDFLEKESPVKYQPASAPPPPPPPPEPSPNPPPNTTTTTTSPSVPQESLYPDGRYAHLWSTYRPLSAIEDASKSDQEKLNDVLEGYKARKAQIGRAAVENCVFEQMKIDECMSEGGMRARLTMCREENRGFERCYVMQSRFLKALGYLSTYDRSPDVDEQIQMHADTLYHRMLAQEAAIEEAKAAGFPPPPLSSVLSPEGPNKPLPPAPPGGFASSSTTTYPSPPTPPPDRPQPPSSDPPFTPPTLSPTTLSLLNTDSQHKLLERMKKMTPTERELEERSVQMEARTSQEVAERLKEVEEGRKKRREEGRGTVADTVAGWFGR